MNTAPKGLSYKDYNALLHAIWYFDRQIKELSEQGIDTSTLERDRQTLHDLFVRWA